MTTKPRARTFRIRRKADAAPPANAAPDMRMRVDRGGADEPLRLVVSGNAVPEPVTLPVRTPDPAPVPALPPQEDAVSAVERMRTGIARRRRRRAAFLMLRLALFVLIPTALAGWYYGRVATPLYATQSEFVIQVADGGAGGAAGGLGSLFGGTGMATSQDSIGVQGYLESRDAMLRLDADAGFRAHFAQDHIDPLQRLEADAANEDAYRLYSRHVTIGYDPTEGIIRMEVSAADPETSALFSERLISYAEERVDRLTERLRRDQMAGAEASFREAEAAMRAAQSEVVRLKELSGVVDGAGVVSGRLAQIQGYETERADLRLRLDTLLANARPNAARVASLEGEIARLDALIAELNAALTQSQAESQSLARVSSELLVAETDLTMRQAMLAESIGALEAARVEANRQTRYLSTNVRPVAPDRPTHPKAVQNTALAFLVFGGLYLMLSLTASILREQVSS